MVNRPGNPIDGPADGPLASDPEARLDAVFGALGSPVRRALLDRLRAGALPVAELAGVVAVSGPAVSKHLRVLEEAGLVARAKEGRVHRIGREPAALAAALDWLVGQGLAVRPQPTPIATPVPVAVRPAPPARQPALAEARALLARLAPAAAVVAEALGQPGRATPGAGAAPRPSQAPSLAGAAQPPQAAQPPLAAYMAQVLRRRLADGRAPRADLADGLAAFDALEAAVAAVEAEQAGEPGASRLEALTAGASKLSWLLAQHPGLADLALLAGRAPAA